MHSARRYSLFNQQLIKEVPFPYLHPKVDLKHLYSNNKLLPDNLIREADIWFESHSKRHVHKVKAHLGKSIEVVKIVNPVTLKPRLYASYFPSKRLGRGSFGSVRLMQDLTTGEWYALKLITYKPDSSQKKAYFDVDEEYVKKEVENTLSLNLTAGHTDKVINKDKRKKFLSLKLMPGVTLSKFKESQPHLLQIEWLKLAIKILQCAEVIYEKGFLHLDIKSSNILYNKSTGELNLVDFGFLEPGPVFQSTTSFGTAGYTAPEFNSDYWEPNYELLLLSTMPSIENLSAVPMTTDNAYARIGDQFLYINKSLPSIEVIPLSPSQLAKLDEVIKTKSLPLDKPQALRKYDTMLSQITCITGHKQKQIATEKTMVYALAVTIKNLFNINGYKNQITALTDAELRKKTANYLKAMTNERPQDRPTIREAIIFFNDLMLEQKEIIHEVRRVGFLNIEEYLQASSEIRSQLRDQLKLVNEVWFIDAAERYSDQYYLLRRELESDGIMVGNRLFHAELRLSLQEIIKLIPSTVNEADFLNAYFFITAASWQESLQASLKKEGVFVLEANSTDSKRYMDDYLVKTCLVKEQYEVVKQLLERKSEKLKAKYSHENKAAIKKIDTIHLALQALENGYLQGTLTFSMLSQTLTDLSDTILSTATHVNEVIQQQEEYAARYKLG